MFITQFIRIRVANMLTFRLNFIGIQLLLLIYTAQSFVLLTANIEDIKKLASKFVSQSLADDLANFVSKATEELSDQMNDADKKPYKPPDVSASNEHRENHNRNYEKLKAEQEKLSKLLHKKEQESKRNKQKPNYLSNESKEVSEERDERLLNNEKWDKSIDRSIERKEHAKANRHESESIASRLKNYWLGEKNDLNDGSEENSKFVNQHVQFNKQSRERKPQDDLKTKHYDKSSSLSYMSNYKKILSENFGSKDDRDESSSESKYKKIDRAKVLALEFKMPNPKKSDNKQEEIVSAETYLNSRYKKIKDRDFKVPTHSFNDLKESKSEVDKLWSMETTRFRGSLGDDTTTKKERTDFDQYDNRNYPKAQLVATSGYMMLPKVEPIRENSGQEKPWWEKEFASKTAAQLKSWLATV